MFPFSDKKNAGAAAASLPLAGAIQLDPVIAGWLPVHVGGGHHGKVCLEVAGGGDH